ncbi:hypothetical protein [Aquidulcibacter sp.]|uniref:hypothetical protein n=1 Tax=Aquidulcibacter sp. TaxID=2052990 RepID=UPI0025C59EB5|nr:hypothetical protein [Aquidulcibacter sp.]MCA3697744.1 hypothetical protein [Aquidulcibacter sp.]
MLSKPTTFILGAGASVDFGFPTGATLQSQVAQCLAVDDRRQFRDSVITDAIEYHNNKTQRPNDAGYYINAAKRIVEGMPIAGSIDNFLHTHSTDQYIVALGKLAIARLILKSERDLKVSTDSTVGDVSTLLTTQNYSDSWYSPFIRMLTTGTQSDQPADLFKNVRFVVFNYDRCLEHVLLLALQGNFGLRLDAAHEVLSGIEIIHPYGSLGSINSKATEYVPFGADRIDLFSISQGIQTFTESVNASTVERAKQSVATADRLVFMGFGFLPQNMDLLAPRGMQSATRIHSTTLGISSSDKSIVKEQLKRFVRSSPVPSIAPVEDVINDSDAWGYIDVKNEGCRDLIQNHRFRLTA